MLILKNEQFEDGGYGIIQTWDLPNIPEGYIVVPDDLDTSIYYEYNGFVFLTVEGDTVTEIEPNIEAWEKWKAEQPEIETEPTEMDILNALLGGATNE